MESAPNFRRPYLGCIEADHNEKLIIFFGIFRNYNKRFYMPSHRSDLKITSNFVTTFRHSFHVLEIFCIFSADCDVLLLKFFLLVRETPPFCCSIWMKFSFKFRENCQDRPKYIEVHRICNI